MLYQRHARSQRRRQLDGSGACGADHIQLHRLGAHADISAAGRQLDPQSLILFLYGSNAGIQPLNGQLSAAQRSHFSDQNHRQYRRHQGENPPGCRSADSLAADESWLRPQILNHLKPSAGADAHAAGPVLSVSEGLFFNAVGHRHSFPPG